MKKMMTFALLMILLPLTLNALDTEIKKGFTVTQIMLDIQNEKILQEEIEQELIIQELIREEQVRQEQMQEEQMTKE